MHKNFGLTKDELLVFKKLNTPAKIQDFLESIPFNYEKNGESCMSPRRVLQNKKAHCIEGALFAGVALLLNSEDAVVVNLKVEKEDDDHIVTLYKRNGYFGAISKTNHNVLRFRDPVYKTVRELVMTYFHEYFLTSNGKKTLLGYSKPINLKKFGTNWITDEKDLWDIAEIIYDSPITLIVPKENKKFIRHATVVERKSASIKEYD